MARSGWGSGWPRWHTFCEARRFHVQVIIGVIGQGALASIARENQAVALARLAAWDKAMRAS